MTICDQKHSVISIFKFKEFVSYFDGCMMLNSDEVNSF